MPAICRTLSSIASFIAIVCVFGTTSSELFAHERVIVDPVSQSIDRLMGATDYFESLLMTAHSTRAEVQSAILQMQSAAEVYFSAAKIKYEKIPASFCSTALGDFRYDRYQLTGTRDGDATSRLLQAVHSKKNSSEHVVVLFDLLLEHVSERFFALYNHGTKEIYFNQRVVSGLFLGIFDALRHEIQHYFEQVKMARGEMTLARFTIISPNADPNEYYAREVRLDELEAFLRDIRFAHRQGRRRSVQVRKMYANLNDAAVFESSLEMYKSSDLAMIRRLVVRGRRELLEIRAKLENGSVESKIWQEDPLNHHYGFDLQNESPSRMFISIPKSFLTRNNDIDAFIRAIDWALKRIDQIEKEVNFIS